MRATIDLPDRVFHALQLRAAHQNSTVESLIVEVIEKEVAPAKAAKQGDRLHLPLIRSSDPGSLRSLTNDEVDEIAG